MKLEKWSIGLETPVFDAYKAPELLQPYPVLQGVVTGHPGVEDNTFVITSSPVAHDGANSVYTASGSTYELGEIDPDYEKLYKGAKERLFASLPRRN